MNYEEIISYLNNLPMYIKSGRFNLSVDRCNYFLDFIKEEKRLDEYLNIVHISGTNGKGSVATYLSSILKIDRKVGLFTSPHLYDEMERIKINGENIDKKDFEKIFNKIYEINKQIKKIEPDFSLSYFEYFFLSSLFYFYEKKVDIVVLETGLGGLLDTTNVVKNKMLAIITNIGLDHMEILGDDILDIAHQKAGIIRGNVPTLLLDNENKEVIEVIKKVCKEKNSNLQTVSSDENVNVVVSDDKVDFSMRNKYYKNTVFSLRQPAKYEVLNATLALISYLKIIELTKNLDKIEEKLDKIKDELSKVVFAGRMQVLEKNIYIDGAHNTSGIKAFLESAASLLKTNKGTLLFSVVKDKESDKIIKLIVDSNLFDKYIITQIDSTRAKDIEKIKERFKECTSDEILVEKDVKSAYELAKKIKKDKLFCVGSLYLMGEILKRKNND